jgi:hypothetical protein
MSPKTQCRDDRGRFCKCDEKNDGGVFKIKIPFSDYIPFFLILISFLIISLPWLFAAPKLLKKIIYEVGVSLMESVKKINKTCDGVGGSC